MKTSTHSVAQHAAIGSPNWRVATLLHAPHRLAFFMAAVMLALTALWWAAILTARTRQWTIETAVPASTVHALLMGMGFMPIFFCGFLFTAGPKWLRLPEIPASRLLGALICMLTGWALALPGFHIRAVLAGAGMALVALGWTLLSLKFAHMVMTSRVADRMHPALAATACLAGAVLLWGMSLTLVFESHQLLRTFTQVALWWFIAPVFAVVSHRMIPFFSASIIPALDTWRPMWLLWVMLAALALEGLICIADLWWWPLPSVMRWWQVTLEAPMALLMLWLALRWGLIQSLKIRLLAMLHGGFVWLGIFFALSAVSHTLMAQSGDASSLGLAPLHAMTMGYLGATMFAMTTRVSSGHGGRKEPADNIAWALYWVLQLAIALRIIAALTPGFASPLTMAAIATWCIAMLGWSLRYGYWFGIPRPDGRPG